jgi:hypothetical protein
MIIQLRRHYHFGPGKISMYLRRYHDVEISKSGVWRILHRLETGRLPASPNATNDSTVDGHAVRKQHPPKKRKVAGSIPPLATKYLRGQSTRIIFHCARQGRHRRRTAPSTHTPAASGQLLRIIRGIRHPRIGREKAVTAVLCADWPA